MYSLSMDGVVITSKSRHVSRVNFLVQEAGLVIVVADGVLQYGLLDPLVRLPESSPAA